MTVNAPTYTPPAILTRADVGLAAPRPGLIARPADQIVGVVFHHAGVSYTDGDDWHVEPERVDYPAVWRAIQRYHMGPHGSEVPHLDIDYNAGVDPLGNVYLGRDAGVRGAHDAAPGYNQRWLGVVLIGDGRNAPEMTDAAWASMLWLWQLAAWVVANAGGPQGLGLVDHGETLATACPGDLLHARLVSLRAFLAGAAA